MDTPPTRGLRFSKPKNIWQWLMLFTPAAVIIIGSVIGSVDTSGETAGKYDPEGGLFTGLLTGPIGALICLGLGFWLARNSAGMGWKILGTLLFSLALAVVNLALGFPGCLFVVSR